MKASNAAPVLVVDDDDSCRAALVTLLELEGVSTVEASNGRVAIDHLLAARVLPVLIILDLNMPVMSGWETIEVLRSYSRFAKVPIVVVTGEPTQSEPRFASIVALQKPVSVDRLMALVRHHAELADPP